MKKQIVRAYTGADIQMLSACDIMADHALENLPELEASNTAWNETFFRDIKTSVAGMLTGYFGIKSGKELKIITGELVGAQSRFLKHLTILRTQIDTNFKDDRSRQKELLADLGFTAYWTKAKSSRSQTALISLLEVFEKGCTGSVRDELTAKKVSDVSLQYIRDNLRRMYELNIRQEGLKDSRKLITEDVVARFNNIYTTTMSYARTARTLFAGKPILKSEFSYAHILQQLDPSSPSSGKNPPETGQPEE